MWSKRDDLVVHESDPFNAEPTTATLAALDADAPTPVEAFYSRNHGPIPEVDAATWSLDVVGPDGTKASWTLDRLRAELPAHEVTATLQCAGNRRAGFLDVADIPGEDPWAGGAIGTATWRGVRLRDLLASVGVTDEGSDGLHACFDGPDVSRIPDPPQAYGSSIPLDKALTPDVLLALEMNGEPLPRVHGGPARIVVPGYVGARSVKWVETVVVRPAPSDNYFQATAYRLLDPDADPDQAGPGDGISLGPWALNCEILSPGAGAEPAPGPLDVTGYAVAPEGRRVARVEVSVDEGTSWVHADLHDDGRPWTWWRWSARVPVTAATRTVLARAWDDTATVQPRDAADLWNPKGYGNTSWPRVVLREG